MASGARWRRRPQPGPRSAASDLRPNTAGAAFAIRSGHGNRDAIRARAARRRSLGTAEPRPALRPGRRRRDAAVHGRARLLGRRAHRGGRHAQHGERHGALRRERDRALEPGAAPRGRPVADRDPCARRGALEHAARPAGGLVQDLAGWRPHRLRQQARSGRAQLSADAGSRGGMGGRGGRQLRRAGRRRGCRGALDRAAAARDLQPGARGLVGRGDRGRRVLRGGARPPGQHPDRAPRELADGRGGDRGDRGGAVRHRPERQPDDRAPAPRAAGQGRRARGAGRAEPGAAPARAEGVEPYRRAQRAVPAADQRRAPRRPGAAPGLRRAAPREHRAGAGPAAARGRDRADPERARRRAARPAGALPGPRAARDRRHEPRRGAGERGRGAPATHRCRGRSADHRRRSRSKAMRLAARSCRRCGG